MCRKQELLDALLKISTDGPVSKEYGICHSAFEYWCQLHNKSTDDESTWEVQDHLDNLLEVIMWNWPKHSGSMAYPIADPSKLKLPSNMFWQSRDKWEPESAYGQLRLELLAFTIGQLQIQLSKT